MNKLLLLTVGNVPLKVKWRHVFIIVLCSEIASSGISSKKCATTTKPHFFINPYSKGLLFLHSALHVVPLISSSKEDEHLSLSPYQLLF